MHDLIFQEPTPTSRKPFFASFFGQVGVHHCRVKHVLYTPDIIRGPPEFYASLQLIADKNRPFCDTVRLLFELFLNQSQKSTSNIMSKEGEDDEGRVILSRRIQLEANLVFGIACSAFPAVFLKITCNIRDSCNLGLNSCKSVKEIH